MTDDVNDDASGGWAWQQVRGCSVARWLDDRSLWRPHLPRQRQHAAGVAERQTEAASGRKDGQGGESGVAIATYVTAAATAGTKTSHSRTCLSTASFSHHTVWKKDQRFYFVLDNFEDADVWLSNRQRGVSTASWWRWVNGCFVLQRYNSTVI